MSTPFIYSDHPSQWQPLTIEECPWVALTCGVSVYTTFRWPCPRNTLSAHLKRLAGDINNWLRRDADLPTTHSLEGILTIINEGYHSEVSQQKGVNLRVRLTVLPNLSHYSDWWRQDAPNSTVLLQANPCSPPEHRSPSQGLALVSVPDARPWPNIKHGNISGVLHWRRQHPEADEILLVNSRGHIAEAGFANMWVIDKHGGLLTPDPVQDGCLPGITSQWILQHADNACYHSLTLSTVLNSPGVFLSSSMIGLQPVLSINGAAIVWSTDAANTLYALQSRFY